MPTYKRPQIQACSWCGGHGLRYTGGEDGDIGDCSACGGAGWEEKRDERGRFVPWEEIETNDEETA